MDIFIIELVNSENIDNNILLKFQQKKISDLEVLKQHCYTYFMLDNILEKFYKILDKELEFINKKPFLKNRKKFFSISHSEEYIALCFSDNNCAIDIEKIKQRDFTKISRRMKFKCNTLNDFYVEWTKFEALYKLGEQNRSLKSFEFKTYMITAVSNYNQENFNIYIQNINDFSKINI